MELRHTEKVILDKDDNSIGYTQLPIYDMIHLRINGIDVNRLNDGITFKWKRIVFPYAIPCEMDVYITYLTDDGKCGECLYMSDLVKKFYQALYGSDDNQYIDGYEEDQIKDYIAEALLIIRNTKADHRSIKQYSFQIGSPIEHFDCHDTRCRNEYGDMDYIPKDGMAMTRTGVYIPYQIVKGKIKFEKSLNIDTDSAYFGYMLPNMGYIHSVKLDWREIDFCEYEGYYFFPKVSGVVTIEYYNDIIAWDECCIEFDERFSRLPVLYAMYNTMLQRGDQRAGVIKQQFDMLMEQYKLYLRREKAKDANSHARSMPSRSRYVYNKRLTSNMYVDTQKL